MILARSRWGSCVYRSVAGFIYSVCFRDDFMPACKHLRIQRVCLRNAWNGSVETYWLGDELRLRTYQSEGFSKSRCESQCGVIRFVRKKHVQFSHVGIVDTFGRYSYISTVFWPLLWTCWQMIKAGSSKSVYLQLVVKKQNQLSGRRNCPIVERLG